MERILIAVDAEGSAQKAVQEIIQEIRNGAELELHLINVQAPEDGIAAAFAPMELEQYYLNKGSDILAPAGRELAAAGIPYAQHVALGPVAPAIVDYAKAKRMDRIILGRHNRGFVSGLLHGSVSSAVVRLSDIAVEVVPITAAVGEEPAEPWESAELGI